MGRLSEDLKVEDADITSEVEISESPWKNWNRDMI